MSDDTTDPKPIIEPSAPTADHFPVAQLVERSERILTDLRDSHGLTQPTDPISERELTIDVIGLALAAELLWRRMGKTQVGLDRVCFVARKIAQDLHAAAPPPEAPRIQLVGSLGDLKRRLN